jgi:hypothetical protein
MMGPEQLALIEQLRAYAESNPIQLADAKARQAAGEHPIPAVNTILLEPALVVTYTVDHNPLCHMRHLSASYRERLVNPHIIEELLRLFQFKNPLSDCIIYVEEGYAINVIEPLEGGLFMPEVQEVFYASRDSISN